MPIRDVMPDLDRAAALLDFWFGPPGSAERERPRDVWFSLEPSFDATCRQRFLADHQRAAAGGLPHWLAAPESCLALILLLDQLPRNLFRGSPLAYAADPLARQVARQALAAGFDARLPPVWRWFLYLPFEHSEDLADQAMSLRLYAGLPEDEDKPEQVDYARRHYEIIARFGRFPHRNAILGRASTAAEEAFLRQADSSF
jgi:uncharacterized protein (DUF924 family)